jgi:subtilisin family serine protease
MTVTTIFFGGYTLSLRKKSREFDILRPSAETIHHLIQLDDVVEASRIGGGVWRVFVEQTEKLDSLMDWTRKTEVVHHAYEVDDQEFLCTFIPTDIINIKFSSSISSSIQEEIREKYNLIKITSYARNIFSYRLTNKTGMNPLKLCNLLMNAQQNVEYVEPDYIIQNQYYVEPMYKEQWHLHSHNTDSRISQFSDIKADLAWQYTKGDPNIVIAIMDDGFDLTNPDLQDSIVHPSDFTRIDINPETEEKVSPDDLEPFAEKNRGDYHGTSCAGLAIARFKEQVSGVAPGCSWMPVRFNVVGTSQHMLLSIFHYVSERADIVSCSWGIQPSGFVNFSETARDVINQLVQTGGRRRKGLVIVFAAGNHNLPSYLSAENNSRGLEYYDPATGKILGHFFKNKEIHGGWIENNDVVVVGAITARCRKALYSNWGPHITVVAPSDNWHPRTVQTRNQYNSINLVTTENEIHGMNLIDVGLSEQDIGYITCDMGGTSGSAPIVAGVCGLMLSVNTNLTAGDIRRLLCETADRSHIDFELDESNMYNNFGQMGEFDPNTNHGLWFGFGKVDAASAVKSALNLAQGE